MIDPKRMSILLVEPDFKVREVVRSSLVPDGFLVLDISNPREASSTAKDVLFDLLIVDPFLPFTQDLVDRMTRFNPKQRVLFVTDYSPETTIGVGLCPKESEVMRKPFTPKDLNDRVRFCLAQGATWVDLVAKRREAPQGELESASKGDEGEINLSQSA